MKQHVTYEAAARSDDSKGENLASPAKALTPEALDILILKYISQELAATLTALARQFGLPEERMRARLKGLSDRGLVRAQGMVDSSAAVYSMTQDGAKKLEAEKKGLAALI